MDHRADEAGRPDAASPSIYEESSRLDAAELVSLRERVAFYEGFHRIVQKNVAHSAELMQQAADRHAEAERLRNEVAAERLQVQRARLEALDGLHLELLHAQTVLDALSARVTTSLAVLAGEGVLTAPIQWAALDWQSRMPVTAVGAEESAESLASLPFSAMAESPFDLPHPDPCTWEEPPPDAERVEAVMDAPLAAVFAFRDEPSPNGWLPADESGPTSVNELPPPVNGAAPDDRTRAIAALLEPAPVAALESSATVKTTCIIHGVPGVSAVRSFQHHLHRQPGLGPVTIREFHLGVLRLDVSGTRSARTADLNSIPGFSNLEEVEVSTGVVIARFPGAPL